MALTLLDVAKENALIEFINDIKDASVNVTFNVYAGVTLKDTFDKSINYFGYSSGSIAFNTSTGGSLVFTIPPATTGIDKIELQGTFPVGGVQTAATWYLTTGLNYPNGGTLTLSQFVLSLVQDA